MSVPSLAAPGCVLAEWRIYFGQQMTKIIGLTMVGITRDPIRSTSSRPMVTKLGIQVLQLICGASALFVCVQQTSGQIYGRYLTAH